MSTLKALLQQDIVEAGIHEPWLGCCNVLRVRPTSQSDAVIPLADLQERFDVSSLVRILSHHQQPGRC